MRDRIIKIISAVLVFGCMAAIFWFSNQPAKSFFADERRYYRNNRSFFCRDMMPYP